MVTLSNNVNGPLNIVRLEGKINGNSKVIYLYFDIHVGETECANALAKDVKQHFIDEFQTIKKKKIDFFLEVRPRLMERYKKIENDRFIYIDSLWKFFFEVYSRKNKKAQVSAVFPNVRFHYVDIRSEIESDLIACHAYLKEFISHTNTMNLEYMKEKTKEFMNSLESLLQQTFEDEKRLYGYIYNDAKFVTTKNKERTSILQELLDTFLQLTPFSKVSVRQHTQIHDREKNLKELKDSVDKIKERYVNKYIKEENKKILSDIIKPHFLEYFKIENVRRTTYLNLQQVLLKENRSPQPIIDLLQSLHVQIGMALDAVLKAHVGLMDLYLLRRFLDKKYITNVVAYTGAYHSINYISYLVKYFGFKITHADYTNASNPTAQTLNLITNKIKKTSTTTKSIKEMFLPPKLIQCSNIKKFPPQFS